MDNRMDDFQYLVEAKIFAPNLTIDTERHGDVLEAIFKKATLSTKKEGDKRDALACILANLIISFWSDEPVRYSRGKGNYRIPRRYGKAWFTYTNIVRTIDRLNELGLIEQRKGFWNGNGGRSFLARIRPTQRLAELVSHCSVNNKPIQELIHLKDAKKRLIDYEDTALTSSMRERLVRYNELVGSTQMSLVIPTGAALEEKSQKILKENYPWTSTIIENLVSEESSNQGLWVYQDTLIQGRVLLSPSSLLYHHYTSTTIQEHYHHYLGKISSEAAIYPLEHLQTYRVFNRGDFTSGGRFYNRGLLSYMGLPKELRKFISIDGEPVVELDYSGLHLRMAHHLKGRNYREDPYEFCDGDKVLRKAYKLAALILLNSGSRDSAVKAIRKAYIEEHIPLLRDQEINHLIDRLIREHAFIEEFFLSDIGISFQAIDSQIMDGILAHFTRKDIPVLPIHDSCVIARKHENELWEVMSEEYRKVIGFEPVIDKKF